jgi:hypothetical protein
LHRESQTVGDARQPDEIHELDVRRIAPVTGLLRRDQDQLSARLQEWNVPPQQIDDLILRHVFGDMSQEDGVESLWPVELRRLPEFLRGEGREPARPRRVHAVLVDIDADALSGEVKQVAADAAAEIQRESRIEPPEIPAMERLRAEPPFPGRGLQTNQTLGVISAVSRRTRLIHAPDNSTYRTATLVSRNLRMSHLMVGVV